MLPSPHCALQQPCEMAARKRAAMRGTILAAALAGEMQQHASLVLLSEALGVLIGFAWEKSFDTAVDDTAEKEHSEVLNSGTARQPDLDRNQLCPRTCEESKIMPPSFIKVVLAMLLAGSIASGIMSMANGPVLL